MDEKNKEEDSYFGVLVGLLICKHGVEHIGMSFGVERLALSIREAGALFEQLECLLDKVGYFDSMQPADVEDEKCRMH